MKKKYEQGIEEDTVKLCIKMVEKCPNNSGRKKKMDLISEDSKKRQKWRTKKDPKPNQD